MLWQLIYWGAPYNAWMLSAIFFLLYGILNVLLFKKNWKQTIGMIHIFHGFSDNFISDIHRAETVILQEKGYVICYKMAEYTSVRMCRFKPIVFV